MSLLVLLHFLDQIPDSHYFFAVLVWLTFKVSYIFYSKACGGIHATVAMTRLRKCTPSIATTMALGKRDTDCRC